MTISRPTVFATLCALTMLSFHQEVQPTPTKKALLLIATYVAVHCYWNNVKAVDIIEDQTLFESLTNVRDYESAKYVIDRWMMGRPRKSDGIKVSGSDVSLEGKRSVLTPHVGGIDSQELTLYAYKGSPAYGFFGVLDSYVKMIYKILKEIKEVNDVTSYWNFTDK